MAGSNGLIAQPLGQTASFNWVLLIELLVCGVLAIFFLGYFDRLFATVASYGIRWYTWRYYRAYIDIQALQISLLGGRIFFKDIRYHAHNESIFVHSGFITWKYWHRKVRNADVFAADPPALQSSKSPSSSGSRSENLDREERGGSDADNRKLPCRLHIRIEGLQAFIYNRSPVYDAIVESFCREGGERASPSTSARDDSVAFEKKPSSTFSESVKNALKISDSSGKSPVDGKTYPSNEKASRQKSAQWQKPELPAFLKLFPVQVDCKTGAAVLGNGNTKSILTAKFESASGVFDAGHAGPLDAYKQLFEFEIVHPVINMKPNLDFRELQLATAARVKDGLGEESRPKAKKLQQRKKGRSWSFFSHAGSHESIAAGGPRDARRRDTSAFPPADDQDRWQGLSRYLDETTRNEHDEWDTVEYARSSTLADVPQIGLSFYWDVPGLVPHHGILEDEQSGAAIEDINGSSAPRYGMDLFIRGDDTGQGGTVTYGPWADRQRVNFQSIFFPANYSDAVPAKRLSAGETRVSTEFKLFVSIEAETVVRIPMREHSKDWKWKGRADAATAQNNKTRSKPNSRKKRSFWKPRDQGTIGANIRPFGWLDVKVPADSTITYVMDMVARKTGYESHVNADVRGLEMSSSVNHGLLWRSGPLALHCDLSVPVGWNTLREWRFDIVNNDLELFILRDHLFLLTDLVTDWSSGPVADYYTFTPFKYLLNLRFINFKLYLNTNVSNIINNPAELDDNLFVILYGKDLAGDVIIPLVDYRPAKNEIFFDFTGHGLGLELCLNSRNTVATFTGRKQFAQLGEVTLKGSHVYNSETAPDLTDRLTFFIHGKKFTLTLFGFIVSHLVRIKENYFGEHLHFRTLEEFQELTRAGTNMAAEGQAQSASNRSNDLDVIMCISAEDATLLLPANMYTTDENVVAEVAYASVDLRITNYYMDLQVDLSPLSVSHNRSDDAGGRHGVGSSTELFFGPTTVAGHRLFGLPPTEPTYVCSWEIDIGKISGEFSTIFSNVLVRAIRCFAFSFDDDENATPLIVLDPIFDITFLRVRTQGIELWLHVDRDAIMLGTDPCSVEFNDWAGSTFSQRLKVMVPNIRLACVDCQSASRQWLVDDSDQRGADTHAFVRTTISVGVRTRKVHFSAERRKQQHHLIESDQRTNRATFLVLDTKTDSEDLSRRVDPPAMRYPEMAEPMALVDAEDPESSKSSLRSAQTNELPLGERGVLPLKRPVLTHRASSASIRASLDERKSTDRQYSSTQRQQSPRNQSTLRPSSADGVPQRDIERLPRSFQPSSVALSSQLAAPYFPLHRLRPDMANVPPLEEDYASNGSNTLVPEFDGSFEPKLNEHFAHSTLVISAEPGIQGFCKPQAITTIKNLLDMLAPQSPEELVDAFQITVLGQVMDVEKKAEGAGTSLEISLRVPQVSFRILNSFMGIHRTEVDQFDIQLKRLALAARHRADPKTEGDGDVSLAHCTLESFALSVKESPVENKQSDAALAMRINDLLTWLAIEQTNKVNASFRELEIETASKKVPYLAALVHRTTLLVDSVVSSFSQQSDNQRKRLGYLAYILTTSGLGVPDPPFLTRASYVMRAAAQHPRNHDSWKIVSRFRYIYQKLPAEEKDALKRGCLQDFALCPTNAESVVLDTWDQWRAWDLAHVRKSLAFQHLYGKIPGGPVQHSPIAAKPVHVALRSAAIHLIIDRSHNQSELRIHLPVVNISLAPSTPPTGLMLLENKTPTRRLVIETSAKSFNLRLNWQITQVVEAVLTLVQEGKNVQQTKPAAPSIKSKTSTLSGPEWIEVQAVSVVENAVITVASPNLVAFAASNNLNVSVLAYDRSSTSDSSSGSVLVHTDSSRTEFRSHSRMLLGATVTSPNLYISNNEVAMLSPERPSLIVTTSSEHITLELKEEILGVLEVVDCLVRDEVAYIEETLVPAMRFNSKSPSPPEIVSEFPRIHVAAMVDSYHIEVALLQSLIYAMSGKTARVSVWPGIHRRLALDLNFDLDEQAHHLTSSAHAELQVISVLRLPAINGHIKSTQTPDAVSVAISMIIETIVLEASAVHGLLTTLRRPEVSKTFTAVQSDIDTIKERTKKIFPESQPENAVASASEILGGRTLLYDVSATLQGLKIEADAPGKSPSAGVASLTLGLNCVQIKACNSYDNGRTVLPVPEIHGRLRQLFVILAIRDAKGKRHCGNIALSASVHCTLRKSLRGPRRKYRTEVDGIEVNIFAESASAVVDVLNHLQDRLKELDLSRERRYLRRLRQPSRKSSIHFTDSMYTEASTASTGLFTSAINVSVFDIQVAWIVGNSVSAIKGYEKHDLVLSIKMIDMATKSESSSTLSIEDLQLQMVPASQSRDQRFVNSALLPEMVFNVAYISSDVERKMSFQAAGKSLDLRLEPRFIVPASMIQRSIDLAVEKFKEATASWQMIPTSTGGQRKNPFGDKRLASLLVDVDFAGAVVHLQESPRTSSRMRTEQKGKYGQFTSEDVTAASLRSPGLAVRVEYKDDGAESSLNAELMVSASSNTLTPVVVPLFLELSEGIKTVVGETDRAVTKPSPKVAQTNFLTDEILLTADPSELLGKTSLNLGIRICSQEFSLSCQPIARVAATARFDDIYITANSIKATEHDHFFAVSAAFEKLQASVQHVYSRQSTFSFDMERIVLSLMNSKHLNGTAGISAIVKIYPTRTRINAKQLQDFLLFREIWLPPEIRQTSDPEASSAAVPETQEYLVQRYRQVANATAFPWNATVAIAEMTVELDLGQAIGKSSLTVTQLWASSRKQSNWEQNLCIGIDKVGITSVGRMSGFVELANFNVRTMIAWPSQHDGLPQTPRVQASIEFDNLRLKAAFDYQAFAIADMSRFAFLMYNVRTAGSGGKDRLVAILDGDQVHAFCTATSTAQALALYQAFERLVQENRAAYAQSLRDVEKYMRRKSMAVPPRIDAKAQEIDKPRDKKPDDEPLGAPTSLYTDVVVTLKSINIGAFPGAFSDNQIFLVDAADVQARFAVMLEDDQVHSGLGMTLGQLRVALAAAANPSGPKSLAEITVEDVVNTATTARGGTILRVPKVIAAMQTWQAPASYHIDYIFKSSFEGKVDVGWNYARIGFIRAMWNTHSRALAARLDRPLPEPAVKITTSSSGISDEEAAGDGTDLLLRDGEGDADADDAGNNNNSSKITAVVVNVPQSKYEYSACEPPVIETPQLRDMGEATPPLEWIGLHRDRLPNLTHQIVIVPLLGVAKEVEDAYHRILGSS